MADITPLELETLRQIFQPLIGLKITWLSIPNRALPGFEPSQIAVIVNTLLDAILPQIEHLAKDEKNAIRLRGIGLSKSPGTIGHRESYPDYVHASGKRVELKGTVCGQSYPADEASSDGPRGKRTTQRECHDGGDSSGE